MNRLGGWIALKFRKLAHSTTPKLTSLNSAGRQTTVFSHSSTLFPQCEFEILIRVSLSNPIHPPQLYTTIYLLRDTFYRDCTVTVVARNSDRSPGRSSADLRDAQVWCIITPCAFLKKETNSRIAYMYSVSYLFISFCRIMYTLSRVRIISCFEKSASHALTFIYFSRTPLTNIYIYGCAPVFLRSRAQRYNAIGFNIWFNGNLIFSSSTCIRFI